MLPFLWISRKDLDGESVFKLSLEGWEGNYKLLTQEIIYLCNQYRFILHFSTLVVVGDTEENKASPYPDEI